MDFLLALLLSLLPPRYRHSVSHKAGGFVLPAAQTTAFAEIVIASVLYAKGFVDYIPNTWISPAAFLEYLFTWQGFCLAFFFLDGVVRLLGALAGQAIGVIPLYLLAWIHGVFEQRSMRKHECPLVADRIERADASTQELRIATCRPRKNWDKWMTVMYEEKLYEIAGAELAAPPRPYIYVLRPKPDSKVVRGLHRYHPDEVFALDDE